MNTPSLCGASKIPVLLGLCLLTALAAAWFGWQKSIQLQAELTQSQSALQAATEELTQARAGTRQVQALEAEIARLRRQSEELAQLRGKVQELQRLKAEHERTIQQNQQLQQNQQALNQSLQAARQTAQQAQRTATPPTPPPAPVAEPAAPKPVWLGLSFNPGSAGGAAIEVIDPNGPAAATGLLPGDFVTGIEGHPVENAAQLDQVVAAMTAGQLVTLDIERDGAVFQVRIGAQQLPE